ncbi:DUF3465 domain-containing protein [Psychromonas sp. 14N.309.X.WAT.B.A12]|uniref:DUF3465 domain-containing protein n=1 Tax=unclassified Psychromonas TaxID=2614957 RepID=UPI0025AF589D|nr:DUF3465 domain-containing protein [Psychromonas sp. 14N.309.X.WAT.B.A12]MDN2662971.1 DUF3465 domain-containing protein [Psychromonas sp. 14N.309.X.WAT.B.A12]
MKNIIIILIFLAFGLYQWISNKSKNNTNVVQKKETPALSIKRDVSEDIQAAYQAKKREIQVTGSGVVVKLLKDDNQGSRHQKFILRLTSGQTILFAHNIDLAPRINNIARGDRIEFYGQYEWNAQGGVVHWTHKDPKGKHLAGWLKHKGEIYQ